MSSTVIVWCQSQALSASMLTLLLASECLTTNSLPSCRLSVSWSVKLLLSFASTVIPGFSLLENHDQEFYFLLDMYVFWNGAASSTKKRSGFLCRCYVCCTVVLEQVYMRCHGTQVTMDSRINPKLCKFKCMRYWTRRSRHRKYKTLKNKGSQAYDHSADCRLNKLSCL
jgi:hypothetical protein